MNSSAKTTAFTFLAAAALGAVAWMGCTTTSGTVDDIDGGNTSSSGGSSSGGSSSGSTGSTDDGGSEGGPAATCENTNQKNIINSEACQSCLEAKCCDSLKGCFDIPNDADAGKIDCNGYVDCIDSCQTDPDPTGCQTECDNLAAEGVPAAFAKVESCVSDTCKTECGQ